MPYKRRDFLRLGAALTAGIIAETVTSRRGAAGTLTPLQVAYAGSMGSVMNGPLHRAAAASLQTALQGRAGGAYGLAHLITGDSIRPDVFISVTPGPMDAVLKAGKAHEAYPIARTEMVIAYSPRSRFAPLLAKATRPGAEPWWKILETRGLRFGRTNPLTDPQGINILFMTKLAARYYHQPDLERRILGPMINSHQIFAEPQVMARLQAGQLDATSAYKIQPRPFGLPYLSLPDAINLGDANLESEYRQVSVTLNGKVHHPAPLVFYAAALKGSAHPELAERFVTWLRGPEAQAILRRYDYDAPGATPALTV